MVTSNLKKVLIVGSSGFIGSHLCRHLSRKGHTVFGLDRQRSIQAEGCCSEFLAGDLMGNDVPVFLTDMRPDIIVFSAGSANVAASVHEPFEDFTASVPGVALLLDHIRKNTPDCHFIFLSSAAVYGNPDIQPVRETSRTKPLSPYGYHKYINEILCRQYSEIYNIRTTVFRIFSAYGEGMKKQVLWDICNKLAAGNAIDLFGTGDETRDFIHVSDIAEAVATSLADTSRRHRIFNLASGVSISISRIAFLLKEIVNTKASIRFNQKTIPGYPHSWSADISKLMEIGFQPRIFPESGISQYGKWYKGVVS